MAMAAGLCTTLQYIGMSGLAGRSTRSPLRFRRSSASAPLAPATGESSRPTGPGGYRCMGWWTLLLAVCCVPLPMRANPAQAGLHWQLEAAPNPAGPLVWVEDTDVWEDLPRQIPLVLRDLDGNPSTSLLQRR